MRTPWSYTFDYVTNEIVISAIVNDEIVEIRAVKKDIKSMADWFEIARIMEAKNDHTPVDPEGFYKGM